MGSHKGSLAKEAKTFLAANWIPSSVAVSMHAMDSEAEQAFVVEQGQYYAASTGCYGYYCTGFETSGDWVNDSSILQLDGPDLHHSAQQAESVHYVYYPPNYAHGQSAYNPLNPYVPGAFVGTDGTFVVSQPYYGGSPYQHTFYSPSYFPIVMQPRAETSTFSLPDNSLPDVSIPTSSRVDGIGAEYAQSSSVNTLTVPEGTCSQSLKAGRKAHDRASNIQNLQSTDVKPASSAHRAANNPSMQSPSCAFITNRDRSPDTSSEQNRGPRSNNIKNQHSPPISLKVYSPQAAGNDIQDNVLIYPDQYNRDDLKVSYPDAKFFVIKSYSEDDIHKSIKYNVWSSTPNGNKRLDAAYQDAHRRSTGKRRACPVFLFFSVNASGKFCGVAEMIGPVDFENDMNFWQRDKWNGSFPVKWHLIKDAPNPNFRHIRLENNENKPVTNSRDTQEVKYIEGIEMLKIFKSCASKTSILDDFMYYEERQKALFDKKMKQRNQVDLDCCLPSLCTNNTQTYFEQATRMQGLVQTPNEAKEVTGSVPVDDIKTQSSVMEIGSLTIEPKESPTTNISSMGSDSNNFADIVTVGSMSIKVNGFASADKVAASDDTSSLLTIGTISFDPKAIKQGNHGSFKA